MYTIYFFALLFDILGYKFSHQANKYTFDIISTYNCDVLIFKSKIPLEFLICNVGDLVLVFVVAEDITRSGMGWF